MPACKFESVKLVFADLELPTLAEQVRLKFSELIPGCLRMGLQHACLKCGAMDHKFQETDKCAYGVSKLLSQACFNCKSGGHHHKVCIKPAKPNVGAPAAMAPPTPPDPKFSAWPEQTKNIPEQQRYENFQPEKNPWGPSLFNN